MTGWTASQLATLHDVQLIRITPADERAAGRTIGVTEIAGRVFVRSWKGPGSGWYRAVLACGGAHISGLDVEIEVDVAVSRASDADTAVDAEFLRKYTGVAAGEMTRDPARGTTLELLPIADGARG